MEKKVSHRGRLAVHAIRMTTRMPVIGQQLQNGVLRKKLESKEGLWKCPSHLKRECIPMEKFSMELLSVKENSEHFPYAHEGVILQLHGGGYVGKLCNKHRDMAGLYLEVSAGFDVLTIDYRVAPEFPFPAALEDSMEAYAWLLNRYDPQQIYVCGDSAGGGLALALVMCLRDHGMPLPAGIVTMSAWTDLTKSGESYKENFKTDPLFGRNKETLIYRDDYYQEWDPMNQYISPLLGDFTGLPPMLMQVGEYEMLLNDTLDVAKKAKAQGVSVTCHMYPGMFHVFQYGELFYPEAKSAWVEIGNFLRKCHREQKKVTDD